MKKSILFILGILVSLLFILTSFKSENDGFVEVKEPMTSNVYVINTPDGNKRYYLDCKDCPRTMIGYSLCIPDIGKCKYFWDKFYAQKYKLTIVKK